MAAALAVTLQATPLLAQGYLENPQPFSSESGIGLVSGWHCDAQLIEVQFDDQPPLPAAYGTSRNGTIPVCGDSDNGWGLLWNYNLLGDGQHTVKVFADGVQFGSATFTVNTLGQEFVEGLSKKTELLLPDLGKEIELTWQQSKQNFVISKVEDWDVPVGEVVEALSGRWTGNWNALFNTGTVGMTLAASTTGLVDVTNVFITNTGCAQNSSGAATISDLDDPYVEITMLDGSRVELEFIATESLSTLGGSFWFASGPCADSEGIFYLSK
jgi:hypothetical protein